MAKKGRRSARLHAKVAKQAQVGETDRCHPWLVEGRTRCTKM